MDKQIMIIGPIGVGKSMLRRALMALELRMRVTAVDVDNVEHKQGEINAVWLDELAPNKKQAVVIRGFEPLYEAHVMVDDRFKRRNKSDRKRNRANRWR